MVFKILRAFYYTALVLLSLCVFGFILMQTRFIKEKMASYLIALCERQGLEVKISQLEGVLPFRWHCACVSLCNESTSFELENVSLRIAILPLLNKTVSISYCHVEKAHCSFTHLKSSSAPDLDTLKSSVNLLISKATLAYRVLFNQIQIDTLKLNRSPEEYTLVARADIRKKLQRFQNHLRIHLHKCADYYLDIAMQGNLSLNYGSLQIKAQFPTHLSSLDKVELLFSLQGPWQSWSAFLHNSALSSPLVGKCRAHSLLANLDTDFSVQEPRALYINRCDLKNDLLTAQLAGVIREDLLQSDLQLFLDLPNLSSLSCSLRGSAQTKIAFAQADITAQIECKDLYLHRLFLNQCNTKIQGHLHTNQWEGNLFCSLEEGNIPLNSKIDFSFHPFDQLILSSINIDSPMLLAKGNLSIDFPHYLSRGNLSLHLAHLYPFAPLLTNQQCDGSLDIDCQLWDEKQIQHAQITALGKNLLYTEYEIEQMTLQAHIYDLFTKPLGKTHLLVQNFHTPLSTINTLDLKMHSDTGQEWPFSLSTQGVFQDPFSLSTSGTWSKEEELFELEITGFSGNFFTTPFSLKQPFRLEQGSHFSCLSPIRMQIDSGELFTEFHLSPIRSTAEINLEHFPLKLLQFFYPNRSLSGTFSLNGFFDATKESIRGALNASLEEAQFLHFDRQEPLKLKGSLQTHLDQNILQTHLHINATGEQFINCSATLAVQHSPYPFKLLFDRQKPISSELIAETKLQDLCDFINLGNHRFTGYLSSRLFLSQTLDTPAIQGNIQCVKGSYENFFTGTQLRDIEAQLHAHNHQIDLIGFSAKDEKKGAVSAEGKIQLNPQAHFPYTFIIELNNLRAIHSNLLDACLTGPLYIRGNLQEAFIQGNLLVPQAELVIPDKLPFEVPVLPVTYVNQPHFLACKAPPPSSYFPCHIQLELTADSQIFVIGKGLSSEWKGNLLLEGTNSNIVTNGTLELLKGDYSLFGKTFKLTEGQIVFNDKSSANATINLSGNLSLADNTITAYLRGPLSSPTLLLQSNPQMSTSAILARILFNKDISDISHLEAIQLATTLLSLSGDAGPSVLETIRKNIGVDRLTIVSQTANPDELAVQIGKYLTKGVMITLSQSATSSQVIVEVEFKHGFIFQAETQEEEEGKFSLKWTHSY